MAAFVIALAISALVRSRKRKAYEIQLMDTVSRPLQGPEDRGFEVGEVGLSPSRSGVPDHKPSPAAPELGNEAISQLERLQALRQSGTVTEAEFQSMKADVLGRK